MSLNAEQQAEREQDLIRERANEVSDGEFFDFLSDNKKDLRIEFCDEVMNDEFMEFCRAEFKRWLQDR